MVTVYVSIELIRSKIRTNKANNDKTYVETAKELIEIYKDTFKEKDSKIEELEEEINKLKNKKS